MYFHAKKKDTNATKQIVEYKYNRAMIFDSSYFHETNGVSMKEGHWNKRINLVYMFKPKKDNITIFDYNKNKDKYLNKYFHPDFVKSINNLDNLQIEEPISDVLQFPIVNNILVMKMSLQMIYISLRLNIINYGKRL